MELAGCAVGAAGRMEIDSQANVSLNPAVLQSNAPSSAAASSLAMSDNEKGGATDGERSEKDDDRGTNLCSESDSLC